jgi:hypothetical protein
MLSFINIIGVVSLTGSNPQLKTNCQYVINNMTYLFILDGIHRYVKIKNTHFL